MVRDKKAIVTGITGQDGAHLSNQLLQEGVQVFGTFRRGSHHKTWRLDELGITDKLTLIEAQLSEPINLVNILNEIQPDFVFHLAGASFISDSFRYPVSAFELNTIGTANLLEACKVACKGAKIFFASSSEIFGGSKQNLPLNEESLSLPLNPYGVSKLAANQLVKIYRDCYDMNCCSGILFNHEGPFRSRQFVTRKISFNLARLKLLGGESIKIGNLESKRDWGFAKHYTFGMHQLLARDIIEDMVFATGKLTSVRKFLYMAAECAGFSPLFEGEGLNEICYDRITGKEIAKVSDKYFRKYDTTGLIGDSSKLESALGWKQEASIDLMVKEMIEADLKRVSEGRVDV